MLRFLPSILPMFFNLGHLINVQFAAFQNLLICIIPPAEIEISSHSEDRVHNLFVDARGCHIIISIQSGVNLYTTRKNRKFKQIQQAKV